MAISCPVVPNSATYSPHAANLSCAVADSDRSMPIARSNAILACSVSGAARFRRTKTNSPPVLPTRLRQIAQDGDLGLSTDLWRVATHVLLEHRHEVGRHEDISGWIAQELQEVTRENAVVASRAVRHWREGVRSASRTYGGVVSSGSLADRNSAAA